MCKKEDQNVNINNTRETEWEQYIREVKTRYCKGLKEVGMKRKCEDTSDETHDE